MKRRVVYYWPVLVVVIIHALLLGFAIDTRSLGSWKPWVFCVLVDIATAGFCEWHYRSDTAFEAMRAKLADLRSRTFKDPPV